MPLIGAKKHINRLRRLSGPAMQKALGEAIFEGADAIKAEAQISLTRGSSGGHQGGKHQHIPSRPGEPPNQDRGTLGNNIEAISTGPLAAEVSSNAPYAAALEFGTSKMAARPYMRPARDKILREIRDIAVSKVQRVVKQSGK